MEQKEPKKYKTRKLSKETNIDFYQPKVVLKKYGWTYQALADKLGLSLASISSIINGTPSIQQVKMIADVIGCTFFEFFDPATLGNPVTIAEQNMIECPHCGQKFTMKVNIKLTQQ